MTSRLLKVEASGNDFLLGVGAWADRLVRAAAPLQQLCDRRRGLGADGVLAVEAVAAARVRLRYRNADGSWARFCANGTRCAARAAVELLGMPSRLTVETDWTAIPAEVEGSVVVLELPPLAAPPEPVELDAGGRRWAGWRLEVGVPHLVLPVADLDAVAPDEVGPPLRSHPALGPGGANVNFVASGPAGWIGVRSFERGVEAETLCCGSGVVAATLVELVASGGRRLHARPASGDELTVEVAGDPFSGPIRFVGPTRFVAEILPIEIEVKS
jgi:diaminopimelate epimerase